MAMNIPLVSNHFSKFGGQKVTFSYKLRVFWESKSECATDLLCEKNTFLTILQISVNAFSLCRQKICKKVKLCFASTMWWIFSKHRVFFRILTVCVAGKTVFSKNTFFDFITWYLPPDPKKTCFFNFFSKNVFFWPFQRNQDASEIFKLWKTLFFDSSISPFCKMSQSGTLA